MSIQSLQRLKFVLCCLGLLMGGLFSHASVPGLASAFVRDSGISVYPAVLFSENFEDPEYGVRWDETRNPENKVLSLVRLGDRNDPMGASLKVTATLGENTGGGLVKWFDTAPRIHVRFYTRFDPACDYIHHFVTLRANRGLRGSDRWSGFGGAGNLPDGGRKFSTALEPWGNWGRDAAPGKWHFYTYWHEMKPSSDGKYWGNSFQPEEQPVIPKNRWICLEFMLQQNTPGNRDGSHAFWVDGQKMGEWDDFSWRSDASLVANALCLESYVTDRWTKNRTNIVYFDQVVIAREYIGPMRMK